MTASLCVWLTGLPASGKTTIAAGVVDALRERGVPAELLDGDDLRSWLSADLGYSAEDRDKHVERVARMARRKMDSGEVPVVACVSPFCASRQNAYRILGSVVEVYVRCPVAVCAKRDPKGLYAKQWAGILFGLTGVDAPYEGPLDPDVTVDTDRQALGACVAAVVRRVALELPPSRVFIPGRWQPLHAGHVAMIRQLMNDGNSVVVGIFETPRSMRNPYSVAERIAMFKGEFAEELASGEIEIVTLPWVRAICYGRDCGWDARRVTVPAALEAVSGTAIRNGNLEGRANG